MAPDVALLGGFLPSIAQRAQNYEYRRKCGLTRPYSHDIIADETLIIME